MASFFQQADLFVYMFVYTLGSLIVVIVYRPVRLERPRLKRS